MLDWGEDWPVIVLNLIMWPAIVFLAVRNYKEK